MEAQMFIMTLNLVLTPENEAETITIIKSMAGPTSAVKGCKSFRIYREIGNDESLMLYEEWDSQKSLDHHIQTSEFRKILATMELAKTAPQISFNNVDSREGFELVERLRS
jgi:quinol monooxygenase YgiN